jgi:hypothetical protein
VVLPPVAEPPGAENDEESLAGQVELCGEVQLPAAQGARVSPVEALGERGGEETAGVDGQARQPGVGTYASDEHRRPPRS